MEFVNGGEKLKPYQSDTQLWPEEAFLMDSPLGHGVPLYSLLNPVNSYLGEKTAFPLKT